MRCNYIREKKYQCGDDYMAVGVFSIIPQEHRGRGKKRKESSEGQKAKNKMDSLRKRQRKALTNFSPAGMFLTGTRIHFCRRIFWPAGETWRTTSGG